MFYLRPFAIVNIFIFVLTSFVANILRIPLNWPKNQKKKNVKWGVIYHHKS